MNLPSGKCRRKSWADKGPHVAATPPCVGPAWGRSAALPALCSGWHLVVGRPGMFGSHCPPGAGPVTSHSAPDIPQGRRGDRPHPGARAGREQVPLLLGCVNYSAQLSSLGDKSPHSIPPTLMYPIRGTVCCLIGRVLGVGVWGARCWVLGVGGQLLAYSVGP